MILCSCTAATDQNLRDQLRAGVRDVDQLGEACGAGACCGGCRPLLEHFLEENAVDVSSGGGPGGSSRAGLSVNQGDADAAEVSGPQSNPPIAAPQGGFWPRSS